VEAVLPRVNAVKLSHGIKAFIRQASSRKTVRQVDRQRKKEEGEGEGEGEGEREITKYYQYHR
jgi:hypothetical protein